MQEVFVSTGFEFGFLFCMRTEHAIDPEVFKPFFNDLPVDPNIKGHYRYRRLSRFRVTEEGVTKLPHGYLFQSKEYNPLVGDIKREFEELNDELANLEMFKAFLLVFRDFCALRPGAEIGVHQIRTTCSPHSYGDPAPEGIHRDGTNFVCIYSVDRNNVEGAKTHLYTSRTEEPVFNKTLYPGELVLVNDRKFLHYTTPVHPAGEGSGTRDVFVLTSPSLIVDF
ncbi:2OG-Fe dioxygenase family protein [Methylobacter sp. sgz302048]|uniref:2OG-Fe dioxygenase family protein n=1 Tax=Methylobacter sp. sgz302048 TaxID=3455945 RepID=UPI003FA08175